MFKNRVTDTYETIINKLEAIIRTECSYKTYKQKKVGFIR